MTSLLQRLLHRPPRDAQKRLTLTVYTRAKCGCCERTLKLLTKFQRRHNFSIELVDVDADPALAADYGATVPVVAVDGKVRFRGIVNPVLLNRLLSAEQR